MRAVQASSTAAKHGITQASATAPAAATGAKGVDAFQALVQALADSAPTDQGGQGTPGTNDAANDSAQTSTSTTTTPSPGDAATTLIALTPAVTVMTGDKTAKGPKSDDPAAGTSATAPATDSGDQTLAAEMAAVALMAPAAVTPPAATSTTTAAPSVGTASAADTPLSAVPAFNAAPIADDIVPNAQPSGGAADPNSARGRSAEFRSNRPRQGQSRRSRSPPPNQRYRRKVRPSLPPNPAADAVFADMAKTMLANSAPTPASTGLKLAQPNVAKPAVKTTPPSASTTGSRSDLRKPIGRRRSTRRARPWQEASVRRLVRLVCPLPPHTPIRQARQTRVLRHRTRTAPPPGPRRRRRTPTSRRRRRPILARRR